MSEKFNIIPTQALLRSWAEMAEKDPGADIPQKAQYYTLNAAYQLAMNILAASSHDEVEDAIIILISLQ